MTAYTHQPPIVNLKSLIVILIMLLALFLRVPALFANHFHADEALFASWARLIAVWRDPLLLTQAVDKPPLLFYLQALFYPMLGPVEWAARLPGWIASLLLVPLVALLAWRLYGRWATAVAATLLITLSPLAIQFSATAFLDPLLTTLLIAALLATASKRPGWAGLWLGLAVVTKYQAVIFLPLCVGVAWLDDWPYRAWKRWLMGLAIILGLLFLWMFLRGQSPALWTTQMQNFGGLRLIYSWELWPRFMAWANLGQLSWGGRIMALFVVLATLVVLGRLWRHREQAATAVDLLLLIFIIGYLALHWLLAVPVWDRYLLPLLPILTLIVARALILGGDWLANSWLATINGWSHKWVTAVVLAFVLLSMLPSAWGARYGRFPIGGYPEADRGAWQVAAFLEDAPYGTVLYDHWYSWQWRYHLFDKGVYVSWFPHPAALAEDVVAFGETEGTRYVVLPATAFAQPIQRAIQNIGYKLDPVFQSSTKPGIVLYRLTQGDYNR